MLSAFFKLLPLVERISRYFFQYLDENKQAKETWFKIVGRFAEYHTCSAENARIYNEQKRTLQEEAAKRFNSSTNDGIRPSEPRGEY